MHYILHLLLERYQSLGGELRMGAEVESINAENGAVRSVTLAGGDTVESGKVISSAGYAETLNLCCLPQDDKPEPEIGRISFMESLFVIDKEPREIGYDKSIVFFCTEPSFKYRVPQGLTDVTSGVLCCPNNFNYPEPLKEGMIRITSQANYALWDALPRKDYIAAKKECRNQAVESLLKMFPDFRDNVVFLDAFTPKTIHKYTGHLNGAVYGSPEKVKDGRTPVKNLFICGTDQGMLPGVVPDPFVGLKV